MTQEKAIAKAPTPIQALAQFLEGRKGEIEKVLPKDLDVERVIKTAIMAAMENPDIGEKCTPVSIYRSVMQASLMGLTVGSGFNEGYFIRYGNSCAFRASYLGWSKVAMRSADVDMIRASVVYSNDGLELSEQPPSVTHKPKWEGGSRGEVIGSLACAYTMENGSHRLYDFTFVSAEDLESAREQADKGRPSPAWRTWTDEMRKKVAIRRLCKMLPRNDAMNSLSRLESNADNGIVDVPDPVALPETDNLTAIVDARFEEASEEELKAGVEELKAEVVNTALEEKKAPAKNRTSRLKERMNPKKTDRKPEVVEPETKEDDEPDYGTDQGDIEF